MENIDIRFFAAIAAVTTALIGAAKKAFPRWVDGKEELLAIVVPLILVVGAKFGGLAKETDWVNAIVLAIGSGIGSGLLHDYVVAPVVQNKGAAPEEKK